MKIVHYLSNRPKHIVPGQRAIVEPVDHPDHERVSNEGPVITSVVLTYDTMTGVFVTQNTVYVPIPGIAL